MCLSSERAWTNVRHSVWTSRPYRMSNQPNHQTMADGGATAFKAMIGEETAEA